MISEGQQVTLKCSVESSTDFRAEVVKLCRGKDVLNVGALGDVFNFLPENRNLWLHHQIYEVARSLDGLDVDSEGIAYAQKYGYEILDHDCTTVQLNKKYDIVLMYEVIEHLDAPVVAIKNLALHLKEGGELILTTPNPNGLGYSLRSLMDRKLHVYYDHVALFMPENIQALCNRSNLSLKNLTFFSAIDPRGGSVGLKSRINRAVGRVNPRLHSNFAAFIKVE